MPPNQDKTSNGKHIEQNQRPQLLCVLLMHRIYTIDLALIPLLGNVAEIQNFLRITKINLWSNLATRGRGVHVHTIVDRDAEELQERG